MVMCFFIIGFFHDEYELGEGHWDTERFCHSNGCIDDYICENFELK